jgi:hypothetical protein
MRSFRQLVATCGNGFGLISRFPRRADLRLIVQLARRNRSA